MDSTSKNQYQKSSTILIAEDSRVNQQALKDVVLSIGHHPIVAGDGLTALYLATSLNPDLLLLDMMMPRMNGMEVLQELKKAGVLEKIPVIIISSIDDTEKIASCIRLGANDYMVKPFNATLLQARIEASLDRKRFREREEQYYHVLEDFNHALEENVKEKIQEITHSHHSTIFAMSKLAESRDMDTGAHLERMREYCKVLGLKLRELNEFKYQITDRFMEDMYIASPLHDLGKISIPDAVLQKPGPLNDEEWKIMKRHSTIGADTLQEVFEKHPNNNFLRMGIDIAEYHHEKWDGSGYPHGLKGDKIPLAGRIVALADVYDALTCKRCYKDAFSHKKSVGIILDGKGSHFDPDIVEAFQETEREFHEIKNQFREEG